MSRFEDGYDEDFPNQSALWWANTERALKGKRGQAFLKEMEEALLALPKKRLIEGAVCFEGDVCANGALALKRRMANGEKLEDAMKWLEENAPDEDTYADETGFFMEKHFGILERLAIHAAYVNDEYSQATQTPEARYEKVLGWVREQRAKTTSKESR